MTRNEILAAIRRAAAELGRAPSRGELRRITGVSHYRVLAEFRTLREAVRAAGLEPNPKGEKISTEDLLADWKRVAEKLGRRPSRAEYVREGRYSAGALTMRFGSWGKISTTEDTENRRGAKSVHRGGTHPAKPTAGSSGAPVAETRRTAKRLGDLVIGTSGDRPATRKPHVSEKANHEGHPYDSSFASSESLRAGYETQRKNNRETKWAEEHGESVLRSFSRVPLAAVPAPVVGMRRVTVSVAQMVVNTLLAPSDWHLAISQNQNRGFNHKGHEGTQREIGTDLATRDSDRAIFERRGIMKDRAVMGEPFDRSPMTNAPVNELGVMVLFGMVAARLGLQVESVQGKFPDCVAKRQVAPGKWQYLRIEFEYESKNFKLHGHDPKGCDMIVCWRHNWKDCPAEIEVIELSKLFGMQ